MLTLGNRKYKKESKTVHALIQRGNKRKRRKNVGFQCFVIIAYINRVPVKHIECVPYMTYLEGLVIALMIQKTAKGS